MNEDRLDQLFSLFYQQKASAKEIDELFRMMEGVPDAVLEALAQKHFEASKEQEPLFPAHFRQRIYEKIKVGGKITERKNLSLPRTLRRMAPIGWAAAAIAAGAVGAWLYLRMHQPEGSKRLATIAMEHQRYLLDTTGVQMHGTADTMGAALSGSVIKVAELLRTESSGYSTITVPYGKRSELLLPDSSKVWLNAGSQLTFPNRFTADKNEVFLVGEGYFEVTKRKSAPFYVRTADMNIRVMGTSFNVRAYPDDGYTSAVLLSGRIEIEPAERVNFQNIAIEPGTSAMLNRREGKLAIQQVTAEDEISWTRRQLILKNTKLSEILTRLSRIYNAEIIDEVGRESGVTFSGKLDLSMPLTEVLKTIYDSNGNYKITRKEGRYMIVN